MLHRGNRGLFMAFWRTQMHVSVQIIHTVELQARELDQRVVALMDRA